ncbi:MAG: HIT family protein [Acidimicrobiia bacterium]
MSSVFTKIINGELPARFVYKDDDVVAFLTINPVAPGHTLVVPVKEVEHWIELDDETIEKLNSVAKKIGKAIDASFNPEKVAYTIVGLEVPHVHIHLIPINHMEDMDFAKADPSPSPELLDAIQKKIIASLGTNNDQEN